MKVLAPFHKHKLNGFTFYKNWWCGAYSGEGNRSGDRNKAQGMVDIMSSFEQTDDNCTEKCN